MSNLKHCPGCERDLPKSMFPKHGKGRCFHCVFNGPGDGKTEVMNTEGRNLPEIEELVYVKHDEKIINTVKEEVTGMTRKDISRSTGLTVGTLYPLLRKLTDQGDVLMVKEVVDDRLTNIYYPPGAVEGAVKPPSPEPKKTEEVQSTPSEVQVNHPECLYTARELADTYLEGFKDGFNMAVQERGSHKKEDGNEG